MLRSLIRRVILIRPEPATVDVAIVWVSGALSRLTVRPAIGTSTQLHDYAPLVERIRGLSADGYTDRAIARHLGTGGGLL